MATSFDKINQALQETISFGSERDRLELCRRVLKANRYNRLSLPLVPLLQIGLIGLITSERTEAQNVELKMIGIQDPLAPCVRKPRSTDTSPEKVRRAVSCLIAITISARDHCWV